METGNKIHYDLVPGAIFNKEERYYARTIPLRHVEMNEIVERMTGKNTTLTRQDVLGCLDLFEEVVEDILCEGMSVSTGLFSLRVNLKGLFNGIGDGFDPERHTLHVKAKASPRLEKRVLFRLKPVRRRRQDMVPDIIRVTDYISGTENTQITPGGMCEIKGRNLKIDFNRQDCGIFLVSDNNITGRTNEYRHQTVRRATERTILIKLPENIPAGNYFLEARKQYMKGYKTGRLTGSLIVKPEA